MSADILRIIPTDPDYVPDVAAQQMAMALFSSFVVKADEMNLVVNDDITFIDPGENWESVSCPACGGDLGGWWQEAAEAAYQNGFSDLNITTPCCGAEGSLNDLIYVPPAGFARFALEAVNPINDVDTAQMSLLSGMMKCQIRKVLSRYS